MTLEMFKNIKQNTLDYVLGKAKEAKLKEDAAVKTSFNDNSMHAAYR